MKWIVLLLLISSLSVNAETITREECDKSIAVEIGKIVVGAVAGVITERIVQKIENLPTPTPQPAPAAQPAYNPGRGADPAPAPCPAPGHFQH